MCLKFSIDRLCRIRQNKRLYSFVGSGKAMTGRAGIGQLFDVFGDNDR